MKTKRMIAILLTLVIATATLASFSGPMAIAKRPNAADDYNVEIQVSSTNPDINIVLYARMLGTQKTTYKIYEFGDDSVITVDGKECTLLDGNGLLICTVGKIHLNLMLGPSGYYGGRQAVWVLRGDINCDNWSNNGEITITNLSAQRVVVPCQNYEVLKDISLEGTLSKI